MNVPPFHLAIPVHDLAAARAFYVGVLGCPEGRSAGRWVDFDFFGHQLVAHLAEGLARDAARTAVDGHEVPAPHFGVVLDARAHAALEARLREAGVPFVVPPHVRFAGRPGEQRTFFVRDPSGHALEFKSFRRPEDLFRRFDEGPRGVD